jgi:hypothetical protein
VKQQPDNIPPAPAPPHYVPVSEGFAVPEQIDQQIQYTVVDGQVIQVVVHEEPPPVLGRVLFRVHPSIEASMHCNMYNFTYVKYKQMVETIVLDPHSFHTVPAPGPFCSKAGVRVF